MNKAEPNMSEKFFCAVTIAFCTIGCKQYDKSIPISIPLFRTANGSKVDFTEGIEKLHWKTTDVLVAKSLAELKRSQFAN